MNQNNNVLPCWGSVAILYPIFSDLRRYRSSAKHYKQPLPKVCVQQFLYENSTQLCSYLVYRFVLGQGQGARKEIDQNGCFVIWLCSKMLLPGTFDLQVQWGQVQIM